MMIYLDYLDYYNQLLVFQQYPDARLVAGAPSWEGYKQNDGRPLLKNASTRLGLDIVVPFRKGYYEEGHPELIWLAVKVYDISHTNITNFKLPPSSYAPKSSQHSELLMESLNAVITNEFHMRVVYELPGANEHLRSYPAGTITRFTITVKDYLSPFEKVIWLSEALSEVYYRRIQKEEYTKEFEGLFITCMCYLLFRRWHIRHAEMYLPNKALLKTIPKELQVEFLKILQESYRHFESTIQTIYHYHRFGTTDDLDDFEFSF